MPLQQKIFFIFSTGFKQELIIQFLHQFNRQMSTDQSFRIDDNIQLVHNFRCLLEEQMVTLQQAPEPSKPIPQSARNTIMIKLNRMRQVTRKIKAELEAVRREITKPFRELAGREMEYVFEKLGRRQEKVGGKLLEDKGNKENRENKENQGVNLQRQLIVAEKGNQVKKRQVPTALQNQGNKVQVKVPVPVVVPTPVSKESKTASKDIRAQIYKELEQLRNLEQRQKVVRNLNESRQRSVSQVKKKPEITPKETQSIYEDKSINKVASNQTFATQYSEKGTPKNLKNVQVNVPVIRPNTSSLICQSHHEYYVGTLSNGIPHGHGRLYNCCNRIPISLPESVQFYSGGFVKGKFQGYGTLTTRQGVKFVGNFKDGLKHGQGSLFYKGKVEIARWANDKFLANI